jgi:hypothetical protein
MPYLVFILNQVICKRLKMQTLFFFQSEFLVQLKFLSHGIK